MSIPYIISYISFKALIVFTLFCLSLCWSTWDIYLLSCSTWKEYTICEKYMYTCKPRAYYAKNIHFNGANISELWSTLKNCTYSEAKLSRQFPINQFICLNYHHQEDFRLAKHLSTLEVEGDNYEAQQVTIIIILLSSHRLEKSKSWTALKKSQETTWTWGERYWWYWYRWYWYWLYQYWRYW